MRWSADWLTLIAGTGIFVYAMLRLEEALRMMAGRRFKKYLQRSMDSPLKALTGGTLVTAILQSSSIVNLMLLSLVGAGIIRMRNAIPAIMGANLGTTLDSWVVALLGFKLEAERISYPLIALALLLQVLPGRKSGIRHTAQFLMGFSLLFIGLDLMKSSTLGLVENFDMSLLQGKGVLVFVFAGFVITALIQSSSATIAITLSSIQAGILQLDQAAGIVIGSELGTTIKLIIGSLGSLSEKKMLAYANFIFNLVIVFLAILILEPLLPALQRITGDDLLLSLVLFQTTINTAGIVLFFPFINQLSDFLERRFGMSAESEKKLMAAINSEFPEDILRESSLATQRLCNEVKVFITTSIGLVKDAERRTESRAPSGYEAIKVQAGQLTQVFSSVSTGPFTVQEREALSRLTESCRQSLHAAKEIHDVGSNFEEMKESSNDRLFELFKAMQESERAYYHTLDESMAGDEERYDACISGSKKMYSGLMKQCTEASGRKQLNEMETAGLMNVAREIYSARKAMADAYFKSGLNVKSPVK